MAMRQRPKVANYTARNEFKSQIQKSGNERVRVPNENETKPSQPNTVIPKKSTASNTIESKRVRHASSGKPVGPAAMEKLPENGGVMTKFRSLDDIPDFTDDYNPFEGEVEDEDGYLGGGRGRGGGGGGRGGGGRIELEEEEEEEEVEEENYYQQQTRYQVASHQPHQPHQPHQYNPQANNRAQPTMMKPQHPPPLPVDMNRGNFQQNYSNPDEESEIEEEDDIPKPRYGGQKIAPKNHNHNDYEDDDDDWNSDDDYHHGYDNEDNMRHLPPLPANNFRNNQPNVKSKNSSKVSSQSTSSKGKESINQKKLSPNPRHPSPLVYDPKAHEVSSDYQSSPQSSHSPEEKLYYDRQPRDVEYKPYTLKDYRKIKPQQYIELGKLKPDLNTDELIAKRANAERIKEFSKNLKEFNKNVMPKRDSVEEIKPETKKEKAIQYAQNIPKPKLKLKTEIKLQEPKNIGVATEAVEVSRLEELTSKHLQNRKQVDAIKKSLGL